jgi:hypothetical protein
MNFANANQLHRKSGVGPGADLVFISSSHADSKALINFASAWWAGGSELGYRLVASPIVFFVLSQGLLNAAH